MPMNIEAGMIWAIQILLGVKLAAGLPWFAMILAYLRIA